MTAHIIYFPKSEEEPTARIYKFPVGQEPIRKWHPAVSMAFIGSCAVVSWAVAIAMGILIWGIIQQVWS